MVSVSVSKKFGIEKSTGVGIEKIWYRKNIKNIIFQLACGSVVKNILRSSPWLFQLFSPQGLLGLNSLFRFPRDNIELIVRPLTVGGQSVAAARPWPKPACLLRHQIIRLDCCLFSILFLLLPFPFSSTPPRASPSPAMAADWVATFLPAAGTRRHRSPSPPSFEGPRWQGGSVLVHF